MKRCLSLSLYLSALTLMPAHAQETGKAALDAWVASDSILGFSVEYATAEENGDELTVHDLTYTLSTDLNLGWLQDVGDENEETPERISIDVKMTVPQLVATNMTAHADGFSADTLTMSDNTTFTAKIMASDGEGLDIDGWMKGSVSSGVFWPKMPKIEDDPTRPIGRWLPLLDVVSVVKYEEAAIDQIGFRVTPVGDPEEGSVVYTVDNTVYKDWENGRIGELSQGLTKQVFLAPGNDDVGIMTITTAETRLEDYDLMAFVELMKGSGSDERSDRVALGSATVLGYRIESEPMKARIDRFAYEDIKIRAPKVGLADLADEFIQKGKEVDEFELASAAFDLYRSFAIGRASVDGMSFEFADPDEPDMSGTFGLDQFLLSDFSSDRLGEFSLSGFNLGVKEQGEGRFERFAIENLEFAPYEPMLEFFKQFAGQPEEPDPLVVAQIFTPASISVSLDGLHVDVPREGKFSLDTFLMAMASTVPPIPTDIELDVDGLEFPVSAIDDREAQAVFKAAGIETLRMAEKIKLHWDENTEDVVLENVSIELGQVGLVRATARIGGLPKSVLENPKAAQAAIVTLNLKALNLELVNEGGVQTALGLAAEQAGVEPAQMSSLLLAQLQGMLAMIGNEAFTTAVSEAAETFFADPRNLRLSIDPENPVPVMQLIGSAQMAPQTLPDLLGITVEANR